MKVFIFRKSFTGFDDWCKQVRACSRYVYTYHQCSKQYQRDHRFDYKESRLVTRQYSDLKKQLNENEIEYLDSYLLKGKIAGYNFISLDSINDLYFKWEQIVFPKGKSRLKFATNEEIGKQITAARIIDGRSRKEVAELVGINEATLRAYENGTRTLPVDVLLLLTQIYGCSKTIRDIIPINESLLFLYKK